MALTFTELGNASVAKQLLNLSFKTDTSKFCSDKATKKARTELNLIKQTCKQTVDVAAHEHHKSAAWEATFGGQAH